MPLSILIAEDDPDIGQQYKIGFEQRGHKVNLTKNGVECLNQYREGLEHCDTKDEFPYDIVITDHKMPFKDGSKVAEEILDLKPKQPIIFVSAYGNLVLEDVEKFEEVDLVAKPFSLDYLIDTVEKKALENQVTF